MCEYEPLILSAIINLLAGIILLLLYLLTVKICEKLTELIQVLCQTINFFDLFNQQPRATRHFSRLNGKKFIELGIYFAEEPHRLRN